MEISQNALSSESDQIKSSVCHRRVFVIRFSLRCDHLAETPPLVNKLQRSKIDNFGAKVMRKPLPVLIKIKKKKKKTEKKLTHS